MIHFGFLLWFVVKRSPNLDCPFCVTIDGRRARSRRRSRDLRRFPLRCIKVQLFPSGSSTFTCCTHLDGDLARPTFGETFNFLVVPRRLASKTVQVNVWSVRDVSEIPEEECVVGRLAIHDVHKRDLPPKVIFALDLGEKSSPSCLVRSGLHSDQPGGLRARNAADALVQRAQLRPSAAGCDRTRRQRRPFFKVFHASLVQLQLQCKGWSGFFV